MYAEGKGKNKTSTRTDAFILSTTSQAHYDLEESYKFTSANNGVSYTTVEISHARISVFNSRLQKQTHKILAINVLLEIKKHQQ